MIYVVMLLVFLTVTFLIIGIYSLLTSEQDVINNRLDKYLDDDRETIALERVSTTEDENEDNNSRLMLRLNQFFTSFSVTNSLDKELDKSSLPFKASEFIISIIMILLLIAVIGILLLKNIVLTGVMLLLGLIFPYFYLKYSQKKRIDKFNDQINDSLTIISNSLKAGYSFFQALEMVTKEMEAPISEEFELVLKKMNLGASPQEALRDLTDRIDSDDLDLVVTAVLIQRQVGGDLSEILDSISDTIRERIRIQGEIKTLTAQGRASGFIVALLPIGLGALLFVINPDYMTPLFTSNLGRAMLIMGVSSQLIGIFLIKKIIEIKV
ncbi:type II secretion system F family protein [Halanaerobacter jeridensis]|uniref:Tight adherence protein B n=1 Tax=Halanaerobacter jeridensis TaxID=706427 RepID=A0A938XSU1_9FIRM|nr:type II secretion system F family protein [Halanaerobacter jeridensis]MBM7557189.1 tight adherence protein B [Halanaerobacter jeridensis]